jgi:hypothetical protein
VKTVVSIAILVGFGIAAKFLAMFVVNLAGAPGAILGGVPGVRSKGRFVVGSLISALGQSYVYLAFVAFVVNWTKLASHREDVFGIFHWPVSFLVCFVPIYSCLIRGRVEATEQGHANAQVEALHITVLLTLIGFFVFTFVPSAIRLGWPWVPYAMA